jgi:hypothetical protein
LHFKRADIDAAIHHAIKTWTALIVQRWRRELRVACVNGRAARQQRVREGRAAVILERTQQWIGVNLIAKPGQQTARIIAAQVIAVRGNRAGVIENVFA